MKLPKIAWPSPFNKPEKQNVNEIDSFNKFNFSQSQKLLTHWLILGMRNIKTSLLKTRWNKHTTLLCHANVPVRFTAQQRAKYSSQQLTANCMVAKRWIRHYFKLLWESTTTEETNFHPVTNAPFRSKLESNGIQVDRNRKFSERIFQRLQSKHPSFSAHWADLMTKTNSTTLPAFSLRIVDFAVQFLLRCKFSFHEKRLFSQVWQWRDF